MPRALPQPTLSPSDVSPSPLLCLAVQHPGKPVLNSWLDKVMTHPRRGAACCQTYRTIQCASSGTAAGQEPAISDFRRLSFMSPAALRPVCFPFNVWTKEPLGGGGTPTGLHLAKQCTRMKSLEWQDSNNESPSVKCQAVCPVVTNNLTLGHCPTPTSHHK